MKQPNTPDQEAAVLDLGKLLRLLVRNARGILLCALLSGLFCLGGAFLFGETRYQSSTILYVSDAQGVENLEDSFVVVLKARQTLMEVIRVSGVSRNHLQLEQMIQAAPVRDTHFFQVVVTSPDRYEARDIAQAIGEVLPRRMSQIMEGTRTTVADEAILENEPSAPNYPNAALLGTLAGLTLALGGVFLKALFPEKKKMP